MSNTSKAKNISFGFSKRIETKSLISSIIRDEGTKETLVDTDYVNSVCHNKIQSNVKKIEKAPIIIPLLESKWQESLDKLALKRQVEVKKESEVFQHPKTLDELAVLELTKESRGDPEEDKKKLPEFYAIKVEEEGKLDFLDKEFGTEPTLDNYNEVPIEEFGIALLRGMGWNPKEGIGLSHKRVVQPVEAVARPKGLGLGASIQTKLKAKSASREDNLELVKGSYVVVQEGPNRTMYGQVESLDEESSRVLVKMALTSETINLSQFNVLVVSKKEYKEFGKVINKDKYERYKRYSDMKLEQMQKKIRKSRSQSPVMSRSSNKSYETKDPELDCDSISVSKQDKYWLRPHLRVRLVDSKYKKGKYYKMKLEVEDVVSLDNCTCRTEEGSLLEGIAHSMVETVIPRDERRYVMILRGKKKGEIGRVLERDRKRCVAHVQLLNDDCKLTKYDYDNICEYTGDVSTQGF